LLQLLYERVSFPVVFGSQSKEFNQNIADIQKEFVNLPIFVKSYWYSKREKI
jgi:hypothetical protein